MENRLINAIRFRKKTNNIKESLDVIDRMQKNNITLREKMHEDRRKKELAEKLLNNEIDVNDLTGEDVEQMIAYFVKDIEHIDTEINKVKVHIESMKNKLQFHK